MAVILQFPSNIKLKESFAFSLQFTAPANMANPATCAFDMAFYNAANLNVGVLVLSSAIGGGLIIGPMDPVARTFTVGVSVNDISAMIPVGVYSGYLRFTDPTGYREELVTIPTATVVNF